MSKREIFKKGKNNVVYPIFLDCIKYISDEFWKGIFEDLSIGKCPKSIYISGGTIYSSNKKKSFSYIIPTERENKSPKEMFTELRELLISNTTICSSTDVSMKKEELKERKVDEDEVTDSTTWSKIRKKNTRELFIIRFVIRMKKKFNLSWTTARHLYSLIQIGFIYKTQTSKDVNFKNKRIESIEGIVFDENKKCFVNEFIENIEEDTDGTEDNDNYLYYYWDRYVTSMMKQI